MVRIIERRHPFLLAWPKARGEKTKMSGSVSVTREPPGPAKTETMKRWEAMVEHEVASIKKESKTKVTDDITRIWAQNRQKIKKLKENQAPTHGPHVAIPKVALSSEPSNGSSSEDDGKKGKKKKREFAKLFSDKPK